MENPRTQLYPAIIELHKNSTLNVEISEVRTLRLHTEIKTERHVLYGDV